MNCPTCGTQLAQALSYCNRCGAHLSTVKDHSESKPSGKTVDPLVWAIVATTILILGMSLGALVLMKDGKIAEGLGTAFVILCFLTLPVVEGLLAWQLLRLHKRAPEAGGTTQRGDPKTHELDAAPALSLPEPVDPVPSITEESTRAFEPLYRERKR